MINSTLQGRKSSSLTACEVGVCSREVQRQGGSKCPRVEAHVEECSDEAHGSDLVAMSAMDSGQPLPGVSVRIVDPETGEKLDPGEPGMILVGGSNIMAGYLGRDDLTSTAMDGEWYITGDIGMLDEDGFLTITDRLARFSKIGGEMVPHGAIEDALQEASGAEERVFAVTAVSDEKKGERIAVVHTADPATIPELLAKLKSMGLPNLFIPRKDDFVKVPELPILGTGKIDLRAVKQTAGESLAK